ncbi:MAG TPA: DUF1338 domain-containing protein [Bacteroidetes bacterium]|nr:DUF1338 domain-containing protein [Bacteroidota bacterium]HCN36487.1 DUF1338 domain-containing protein [Bacteroidota bacterium]
MNNNESLKIILKGLMDRYRNRVPDVNKILNAMVSEGIINNFDEIVNDHIAFRTMGVPQLGIKSLEKIFLHYGYSRKDAYDFPEKKLNAFWYEPENKYFPRIFISELRVWDLPEDIQKIITSYTDEVKSDPVDSINLDDPKSVDEFLHSSLWRLPTKADYEKLLSVSEYAAWVIYNRYYLNHYTISVHRLKDGYNTLEKFNNFLVNIGVKLNNSGGIIKKSPDGLLLQSSTVAELVEAEFEGGEKKVISGSYVEFAERGILPEFAHLPAEERKREHFREGFEAGNADKIFESTFTSQTGQK